MKQIVIEIFLVLIVEDVVNGFVDMIAECDEDVTVATTGAKLRDEREILYSLLWSAQLMATEVPW